MSSDGDGDEKLIEYGCLVIAGVFDGVGTFTVNTVYNLYNDISEAFKRRLREVKPTPWESAEVWLPEGEGVAE